MDWKQGMGLFLKEAGNFLRILAAVFVASLGGRLLVDGIAKVSNDWSWLLKLSGTVLIAAGSVASVVLLYQRVVRIRVDAEAKSAEPTAPESK